MGFLDWFFSGKAPATGAAPAQQPRDPEVADRLAAAIQRAQTLQQDLADDTGKEEDFTGSATIPVGRWLRITLPNCPSFVGDTYLDPQAGRSAKGSSQRDPDLAAAPFMTVRLPMPGATWRALGPEERRRWCLPDRPGWLEFYGAQPEPGTLWQG
jgi:hypothetical protein